MRDVGGGLVVERAIAARLSEAGHDAQRDKGVLAVTDPSGSILRIDVDGACTAERSTLFSYRRDGRTGRQGMVVAMMGA